MNSFYEELKSKAFSAFRMLSRECAPFEDASMLVGSADTEVSLTRSKISKTIDVEWIEKIENALGALDAIIRNPSVAIEDVDEVLPVELSKHITEKSIKHLAQHTNFILDVKDDGEVVPLKILNVFHEETHLTYENKFVNTLLSRLSAFVDKRLRALGSASGIEMNYRFGYSTEFEHLLPDDGGRNSARINLRIELTSPLGQEMSESDLEINERFINDLNRVKRINMALISFRASAFAEKLGKNYIRPPVIRTNAILKNKNLRELLALWEYIEEYDKVGYSFIGDKYYELPSSDFVGGMYSSVALQYLTLYSGIASELENNRLISEKHLFETLPEFDDDIEEEEIDDYMVYDSEYRKTVPVSRLMNNRKKLSEDERKIRAAILVSLKADEMINAELLREEAEKRRLAREKRLAEEEERRRREQEAAKLLEKEQIKREVEIRYRRSFLSRYIQAESYVQDYYTEIKNELLSYKGVKSRSSWAKESFNRGRIHLAKMDVKGKALYLYLALEPAALEGTKYKFTLAKGDCPVLLKIKSERKKKHALELIAQLMAGFGLLRIEREAEDYHLPYEDNEALIQRGLIKIILPKGESLDENTIAVKADLSGIESKKPNGEEQTINEETEETVPELVKREVEIRYRRSFLSRYIQAESYVQDYYTEIKNELLSYKGVKSRSSWAKESFNRGRIHLAKMDVKGKALYLYLALEPAALEGTKYKFTLAKGDCPVLLKIKSERKKKHALELIAQLMAGFGLLRIEREAEDYHLPYEDNEALIQRGLIKIILPKGESLDENAEPVKADLNDLKSMRKDTKKEELPVPSSEDDSKIEEDENPCEENYEETTDAVGVNESEEVVEEVDDFADDEAVKDDVAEEILFANVVEDAAKFEAEIDEIIRVSINGRRTVSLSADMTPLVSRGRSASGVIGFVFSGDDPSGALIVVPYTRAQYIALPRKKKKNVLMNVKALLKYAATARAIEALRSLGSDNKRIAKRIAALDSRLKAEMKFMPTSSLWSDAVQRVVK